MHKTPLNQSHKDLGARMVEFAGFEMPIQYEGVRQEHCNTRENIGLFDVSHMGEFFVRGEKALETLQWITTNDVSRLEDGCAQYTLFPNKEGGIVDDLIVYCLKKGTDYLLCVNAANIEKDFAFVQENNRGAEVTNESHLWSQVAVQGPKAMQLVEKVFSKDFSSLPSFQFTNLEFQGHKGWLARTGYTGEDGVEVFIPNEAAASLWQTLMDQGKDFGAKPVGLAARDTLRTEVKFPLYGHEINDETNPYEAGLGWVVKPDAKDFLGKEPMLLKKQAGLERKLIAFKMVDKGIPREGYQLFSFDNQEIGKVTSGTMSPSLGIGVGIGYVSKDLSGLGSEVFVDIRGRKGKATIVKSAYSKS